MRTSTTTEIGVEVGVAYPSNYTRALPTEAGTGTTTFVVVSELVGVGGELHHAVAPWGPDTGEVITAVGPYSGKV